MANQPKCHPFSGHLNGQEPSHQDLAGQGAGYGGPDPTICVTVSKPLFLLEPQSVNLAVSRVMGSPSPPKLG